MEFEVLGSDAVEACESCLSIRNRPYKNIKIDNGFYHKHNSGMIEVIGQALTPDTGMNMVIANSSEGLVTYPATDFISIDEFSTDNSELYIYHSYFVPVMESVIHTDLGYVCDPIDYDSSIVRVPNKTVVFGYIEDAKHYGTSRTHSLNFDLDKYKSLGAKVELVHKKR